MVVSRTQMPYRARLGVCCLIALGAIASVISVVRVAYVSGAGGQSSDPLEYFSKSVPYALLGTAEYGIGIMAISLAALRPLFAQCWERTRALSSGRKSSRLGGSSQTSVPMSKVKSSPSQTHEFRTEGGTVVDIGSWEEAFDAKDEVSFETRERSATDWPLSSSV